MNFRSSSDAFILRSAARHHAARVLALALCLTAALAVWALVNDSFDTTEGRVLATTVIASLLTFVGLVGATLLDRTGQHRRVGQATIVLSAIDFSLAVLAIWTPAPGHSLLTALAVTSVLLPACAHACLMLGRQRPSDRQAVRTLTRLAIAFATATSLLSAGTIAFVAGPVHSGFWRALGVLVVLATLTTLLAPILRRITREHDPVADATSDVCGSAEDPPDDRSPTHPIVGRQRRAESTAAA